MAHELDFSSGRAGYVELGENVTAWHKHGQAIAPAEFAGLTGAEKVNRILKAGELDWNVEPFDIYNAPSGGKIIQGFKDFRRSDTEHSMGVFRSTYTILQNRELLTLVEPLLDSGVMEFETAGSLREGADVWGLFRFNPKDEAVADYFRGEKIIPFALLSNNHSYRKLVTIMETPIRVVCANTLGMAHNALPGGRRKKAGRYPGAILLRHTKNVKSLSVEGVTELWTNITERYAAVVESYKQLHTRYLTEEEFDTHVLDILAPLPQDVESKQYESTWERAGVRRKLVTSLYNGEGKGITGDHSAWEAYQAAVEAVDHGDEAFPLRKGDRLDGIFPGGSLANKKQDVLNSLHDLVLVKA